MMNVTMLETVACADDCYMVGEVVKVPRVTGNEWVARGLAEPTDLSTEEEAEYFERLWEGAGQPCLYLPFVGEFGHLIMHGVRFVHFHEASEKIVCCRKGDEVLFPTADAFITQWEDPIDDARRGGSGGDFEWDEITSVFPEYVRIDTGNWTPWQEYHCSINPTRRIELAPRKRGLSADVVLGVRHREYCPDKNWNHWQKVADALIARGYTVAVAGKRPYTQDLDGIVCHAGDYDDTDASVELIQNCKLYVGTDTGVSHLAALVEARMLIFQLHKYRDYVPRMQQVSGPGKVTHLGGVWDDPDFIVKTALEILDTV